MYNQCLEADEILKEYGDINNLRLDHILDPDEMEDEINSHIRHSRAGRALLRWRKECGRLWVQLASAVQAPMHSVAYMYIHCY